MLVARLSLALAASLATASPLNSRRDPAIRQGSGFALVARVTGAPGPAFDTPVGHWRLTGARVGAGREAAVLNATAGATFFVNGTAAEVADRRASVALPPMAGTGVGAVPVYVLPLRPSLGPDASPRPPSAFCLRHSRRSKLWVVLGEHPIKENC